MACTQEPRIYAPKEVTQNVQDLVNRCAALVFSTLSREMNKISMHVQVVQVSSILVARSTINMVFQDTGTVTKLLLSRLHWLQQLQLRQSLSEDHTTDKEN